MDKKELQKALKPIVKECIKEVLFEEGVLSTIVSEIATGLGAGQVVLQETRNIRAQEEDLRSAAREEEAIMAKIRETKKSLMDSINKDAYGGIDLFEGTSPTPRANGTSGHSPLSGHDPRDPGVDISGLVNLKGSVWNKLK
jgi:hypothetical protein